MDCFYQFHNDSCLAIAYAENNKAIYNTPQWKLKPLLYHASGFSLTGEPDFQLLTEGKAHR
jgi:hypothetical protein